MIFQLQPEVPTARSEISRAAACGFRAAQVVLGCAGLLRCADHVTTPRVFPCSCFLRPNYRDRRDVRAEANSCFAYMGAGAVQTEGNPVVRFGFVSMDSSEEQPAGKCQDIASQDSRCELLAEELGITHCQVKHSRTQWARRLSRKELGQSKRTGTQIYDAGLLKSSYHTKHCG